MTIDYLKQINGQLVAYTNKMMELAVDSKNTLTNICLATLVIISIIIFTIGFTLFKKK